jgi:uncharacterized membrane protein
MKKVLWTFVFLSLAACNYKLEKLSAPPRVGGEGVMNQNQIDFAVVMEKVIQPKCLECHAAAGGNRGGVNLETYAEVRLNLADVKADVEDGSMPKRRQPLTQAQKDLILNWIAAGAPEKADSPTQPTPAPVTPTPQPGPTPVEPVPQPNPAPVTPPLPPAGPEVLDYATVKTQVIDRACLKCHSAPANRGDVNLESYQEVLKNIVDIKMDVADGTMPKRSTLTPEQKNLILDWIAAGAPETARPAHCEERNLTKAFVEFVIEQKDQTPDSSPSEEEGSCLSRP